MRPVRNLLGKSQIGEEDTDRAGVVELKGNKEHIHFTDRQSWEDLLTDFVTGKEIEASLKREIMKGVGGKADS